MTLSSPPFTSPGPQSVFPARFGFREGDRGTHGSRSIMFEDLEALLGATPAETTYEGYRIAIMDENVLGRGTASTRLWSWKKLRELYSLDRRLPVFRCLRQLWQAAETGRPVLAILCACARDPLLRMTVPLVLGTRAGEQLEPIDFSGAVESAAPGRFSATNLKAIGNRTCSSWTQSGHLTGGRVRLRSRPQLTCEAVAYALALGRLAGARGPLLFSTFWTGLLDSPQDTLLDLAESAARKGWIDLRRIGTVIEVAFPSLLLPQEMEALSESS